MDWQSRYHYQEATGSKHCGNCAAFKAGHCRMFDAPVEDDSVCDEWTDTWPEKKTSAQQVMGMAERTGDPSLDALLNQFMTEESGYISQYCSPDNARGNCTDVTDYFVRWMQQHGVDAHSAQGSQDTLKHNGENIFPPSSEGTFPPRYLGIQDDWDDWHDAAVIQKDGQTYMVDFTASQYGEPEFPHIQKLQTPSQSETYHEQGDEFTDWSDPRWQRQWTSASQQVMYHVAPRSARESILANGLVPSDAEGQQERGVYLTRNPDFWRSFYRSPGSPHEGKDTEVWEVNMDGLPHHDDLTAEHGEDYYHPDVVAPNRLRLLSDERTASWDDPDDEGVPLPPILPPERHGQTVLYHRAPSEYRDAILREGLRPGPTKSLWNENDMHSGVYMAETPQGTNAMGEDEPGFDTWKVNVEGLPLAPDDYWPKPAWVHPGHITPDRISLLSDERTAGWEVVASPEEQAMLDANRGQDLAGLPGLVNVPNHGPLHFGSHRELQGLAADYMHQAGMPYNPPRTYVKVNPEHASRIAAEYDRAEHRPNDPKVAASYRAMIAETKAQYDHLVNNGYKFEFYPNHDPYPNSPREAVMDLHRNRHMYVFPTDEGFGTEHEETNHPLLADSGERWNGKPVTYNDLFRAVHDVYGHAKEGVGFRADGEDNAWRQHVAMFSPQARPAMTAETRGQNSWVNYGPHGEANRTADQASTVYADQKATVMPEWTYNEPEDAARTSRKREPSYVQRWIEQTHGPDEFHGHESDCLNPKCRHHWNEEEENELLNYGEIRCPECGLMQNMNGTIGPFNEEHSYHGHMPSGGTRGGLSFDDMGALGEQIVKRAALPGFTFKHDFSTQHKAWPVDHIWTDANGQDHGFEIKTNHSQAQPRFKLGDAKERNEKIKYCAENGLRQGLIGVRLNFHNNTADVFHRPQFTDTWVGAPTMTHMGTFDFSDLNPFKSPGEVPENLPEEHEDFPF